VTEQIFLLDKAVNNASAAAGIIGSIFLANITRTIAVNAPKLIYNMIDMFYRDQSHFEYTWFKFSGNLPAALYNFLRTRDCFLDTFPFPSLEVSFSYKQSDSVLSILGEVNWQPPNISFPNLPVRLHTGAEYRIAPQYMEPDLGCKYSAGFARFDIEPEYSVTSKNIPVAWDSNLRCFRSMIPPNRQRQQPVEHLNGLKKAMKIEETRFSAKIVMHFPENVRFEQTTRYSIELEIDQSTKAPCVASRPCIPTHNVESEIANSPTGETVNLHLSPRSQESPIVGPNCRMSTPYARVDSWLPSYTNTPLSKRGRKDSVDEHVCVGSDDDGRGSSIATSSVERSLERLVPKIGMVTQSRKYSPWSCDNHTDEVANQVDVFFQNRDPGQAADGKEETGMKDVEYDADSDNDSQEPLLPSRPLSQNWQNHTQPKVSPTAAPGKAKTKAPKLDIMNTIARSSDGDDIGNLIMEKFMRGERHNYFVKGFFSVASRAKAGIEPPSTSTLEAKFRTARAAIDARPMIGVAKNVGLAPPLAAFAVSKARIEPSATAAVDLVVERSIYEEAYNKWLMETHENAGERRLDESANEQTTFKAPKWRKFAEDLEEGTKPKELNSMVFGQSPSQSADEPPAAGTSRHSPSETHDAATPTESTAHGALAAAERLMNGYTLSQYRSSGGKTDAKVDPKATAVNMGSRRLELLQGHEKRFELNKMFGLKPSPTAKEALPPCDEPHHSNQHSGDAFKDERTHDILPQKRKATKQRIVLFRAPSSFRSGRLALDQFEHIDLELATKRQRLSERVDSGCDMRDTCHDNCNEDRDDPFISLANITTGKLGEAARIPSPLPGSRGWFKKLSAENKGEGLEGSAGASYGTRSRAYETDDKNSKVMLALKKKGSVKRMVFLRRAKLGLKTGLPTPPTTDQSGSSALSREDVSPINSIVTGIALSHNDKPESDWCYPSLYCRGRSEAYHKWNDEYNELIDKDGKQAETIGVPDQREIQQTYQQLLQEKHGKDKAVPIEMIAADASPASKYLKEETRRVDEEEKKAFEKIFLDENSASGASGSEMDWSTQEEGLSQELSGLDLKAVKSE
jgi:hypothetical protein